MNAFFRRMHRFVSNSISPASLSANPLTQEDFEHWSSYLDSSKEQLTFLMSQYLMGVTPAEEKRAWMLSMQQHLTALSDQINTYFYRQKKTWANHPDSGTIRSHYLKAMQCFQHLLEHAKQHYPAIYHRNVPMTRFRLFTVRPEFRQLIRKADHFLSGFEIDIELRRLITTAARAAKRSRTFSESDLLYFQSLFAEILESKSLKQKELTELLIRNDFNKTGFYVYLMRQWKAALENIGGLHEQLELMVHKHQEIGDQRIPGMRAQANRPSLIADLLVYCRRHKEYLHELIELRKMMKQDELEMDGAMKILSNFSVPQIALFFKLQVEKGLIIPKSLASLYRFIAANFYTEKALMISTHSLKREYEDVQFKTAYKMYLAFLEFIAWLDEHFQVKSYRPA